MYNRHLLRICRRESRIVLALIALASAQEATAQPSMAYRVVMSKEIVREAVLADTLLSCLGHAIQSFQGDYGLVADEDIRHITIYSSRPVLAKIADTTVRWEYAILNVKETTIDRGIDASGRRWKRVVREETWGHKPIVHRRIAYYMAVGLRSLSCLKDLINDRRVDTSCLEGPSGIRSIDVAPSRQIVFGISRSETPSQIVVLGNEPPAAHYAGRRGLSFERAQFRSRSNKALKDGQSVLTRLGDVDATLWGYGLSWFERDVTSLLKMGFFWVKTPDLGTKYGKNGAWCPTRRVGRNVRPA